jgi:serine O-acetyltransferase
VIFKRIIDDIDSIIVRDPAARSRLEVMICYPGFHALLLYRLSSWLWRHKLKLLGRFISYVSRFLTGIDIHPGATIGRRFFIDHGMGVVIGETATIGDDVTIYHDVTLGGVSPQNEKKGSLRHPQIGNNVIIGAGAHLLGPLKVKIGNNVIIGAGAHLLGPLKVNDGARIGSNAVVVQDVEAKAIMVGVPAHAVSDKVSMHPGAKGKVFDAYGTSQDENADPLLVTLKQMREEMQVLQRRVTELEADEATLLGSAQKWDPK